MKRKQMNSFVRATLKLIKSVELSDDPCGHLAGPEYDLYEVTVEHGPEKAFLTWFSRSMLWGSDMSRVGSTTRFMDFGQEKDIDIEGHVFDFTFDDFFPLWLRAASNEAKAEIANMASKAFSNIASA